VNPIISDSAAYIGCKLMILKKEYLKERADFFVPYLATFYYVEIIYFMFFVNFLYGKFFSVAIGLLLSGFLTFHVIRLFNKKNINRKLQLYFMDFHFAYSLAFFLNKVFSGCNLTVIDHAIIYLRLFIALAEIMLVFVLTDRTIKNEYSD
jgi:hypothetical protein